MYYVVPIALYSLQYYYDKISLFQSYINVLVINLCKAHEFNLQASESSKYIINK